MNIHDTALNGDASSDLQDKLAKPAPVSDISQELDDYASMSDEDMGGDGCHPLFRNVPSSVGFNKLRKRLLRQTRQAMDDIGFDFLRHHRFEMMGSDNALTQLFELRRLQQVAKFRLAQQKYLKQ